MKLDVLEQVEDAELLFADGGEGRVAELEGVLALPIDGAQVIQLFELWLGAGRGEVRDRGEHVWRLSGNSGGLRSAYDHTVGLVLNEVMSSAFKVLSPFLESFPSTSGPETLPGPRNQVQSYFRFTSSLCLVPLGYCPICTSALARGGWVVSSSTSDHPTPRPSRE